MKREIGSEFWSVPICSAENNLFPADTQWFSSGRAALETIIKKNNFHSAALPSWCCESLILPFLRNGIEVDFYPVNGLEQDFAGLTSDVILLMDYFGYTGYSDIGGYKGTIIRDVTHSIFSNSYPSADYCFGSLRKWAGFWTGGYAWGVEMESNLVPDEEYTALRKSAMEEKARYIQDNCTSKGYLELFAAAEERLDNSGIKGADLRDIELAKRLDITFLKEQRRKNAEHLLKVFGEIAIFPELAERDCPLFVPIRINKRSELRKYLIEQDIFCPIHWPKSQYHKLTEQTEKIYDEELSLVCDQRYKEEDMERIIKAIKCFWKGI